MPGLDVAGSVAAVGSAVTRFSTGDEVFGISRGSFAEYAAVREDKLSAKPANLTFEQAAVVPISAGTALQALTDAGRVEAGQRVHRARLRAVRLRQARGLDHRHLRASDVG